MAGWRELTDTLLTAFSLTLHVASAYFEGGSAAENTLWHLEFATTNGLVFLCLHRLLMCINMLLAWSWPSMFVCVLVCEP